jgi:hypothetical protein
MVSSERRDGVRQTLGRFASPVKAFMPRSVCHAYPEGCRASGWQTLRCTSRKPARTRAHPSNIPHKVSGGNTECVRCREAISHALTASRQSEFSASAVAQLVSQRARRVTLVASALSIYKPVNTTQPAKGAVIKIANGKTARERSSLGKGHVHQYTLAAPRGQPHLLQPCARHWLLRGARCPNAGCPRQAVWRDRHDGRARAVERLCDPA